MDIKTIFSLLRHLSSQTNIKDLTYALSELLLANFSGVQVTVYEVQGGRSSDSREARQVGMDVLSLKPSVYLDQHPLLNQAFLEKEERQGPDASGSTLLILPVELYDRTVSHLVVAHHPYSDGPAFELLLGLLRIFTDIFRSLHEKGYDPLTRILNRQAFDQAVTTLAYSNHTPVELGDKGQRYSSIAILDIDKFKDINDQYGHSIGDETLVLFSQTIRSILRQEDLFFRYGGEEFVIFVKEVDNEQAQAVLERCRQAVESRRFPQVKNVTVSIGVANLEPGEHPSDSLSKADKALYYAKNNGRNQVHSYEDLVANALLEPMAIQEGSADFWE